MDFSFIIDYLVFLLEFILPPTLVILFIGHRWKQGYWWKPWPFRGKVYPGNPRPTGRAGQNAEPDKRARASGSDTFAPEIKRVLLSLNNIEIALSVLDRKHAESLDTQRAMVDCLRQIAGRTETPLASTNVPRQTEQREQTQAQGPARSRNPAARSQAKRIADQVSLPFEGLTNAYNAGISGGNLRDEFVSSYQPKRLGIANAQDRGRDPTIEPVFAMSGQGEYLAAQLDGSTGQYAVFPRYGLLIEEGFLFESGMDYVFDCG
ncbi:MAG TPA: hypothetical protein VJX67_23570, partial [Blastocatellia bacterium]|nr:hypothetical protein [Blastocatellia bacterium]